MKPSNIEKYKIFAFALLFKKVQSNSVFFRDETAYSFIKEHNLTISLRTFKKYFKLCEKLGIIEDCGENKQFKSWKAILSLLEIEPDVKFFNQYFNKDTSIRKFSEMVDWVNACFIRQGHETQLYKISKNSKVKSIAELYLRSFSDKSLMHQIPGRELKILHTKCRKEAPGLSLEQYCKRVLDDQKNADSVVDGSHHLSKKYNYSPRTANNYLIKMGKKGLLNKVTFRKFHKVDSEAALYSMQAYRTHEGSILFPSKDRKAIIEVIGSKISYSGIFAYETDLYSSSLSLNISVGA